MYTLHCTKKLLDRIKDSIASTSTAPTTALGNWYATVLFWKPQVALLVNERTLMPVLMPLAPASTLSDRFPDELATLLCGAGPAFIASEVAAMSEVVIAKTANRSVVGTMNEFVFLAESYRQHMETTDLLALSMRLADTPAAPSSTTVPAALEGNHWRFDALELRQPMSIAKDGRQIVSLEDWFARAGPKADYQWKDDRSAKETARAWLDTGDGTLPAEVADLLATSPHFGLPSRWTAEPEARLRFDKFPGEPRNSDLVLFGSDPHGDYVLAVEAKADEAFGETVGDA